MWNTSREAARRLFQVVDAEPSIKDIGESKLDIRSPRIELSNVSFTYPTQLQPALRNVTFSLPEGKAIAIVGPSGAGKSTIANLLFQFWDYEVGEITLGGTSLKALDQDEVRKRSLSSPKTAISSIPASAKIYDWRVDPLTPAELESAARAAQIHEFIATLPKGYDTLIGEQGLRLSGGERQRLAIARALLKEAPILYLR